jgi:hypothetical protein
MGRDEWLWFWYRDKQFDDDDEQTNEAQDSNSRRKKIGHEMKIVAELMIQHVVSSIDIFDVHGPDCRGDCGKRP